MLQSIYCATMSETSERMCRRADKWKFDVDDDGDDGGGGDDDGGGSSDSVNVAEWHVNDTTVWWYVLFFS